ncbi:MAG: hypothetical protein DWQ19_08785 [Crenarchaeota archaeon]|nr:MAG: hypothetical protein DWQ19_08785 [Thermoproteota archaeon]
MLKKLYRFEQRVPYWSVRLCLWYDGGVLLEIERMCGEAKKLHRPLDKKYNKNWAALSFIPWKNWTPF